MLKKVLAVVMLFIVVFATYSNAITAKKTDDWVYTGETDPYVVQQVTGNSEFIAKIIIFVLAIVVLLYDIIFTIYNMKKKEEDSKRKKVGIVSCVFTVIICVLFVLNILVNTMAWTTPVLLIFQAIFGIVIFILSFKNKYLSSKIFGTIFTIPTIIVCGMLTEGIVSCIYLLVASIYLAIVIFLNRKKAENAKLLFSKVLLALIGIIATCTIIAFVAGSEDLLGIVILVYIVYILMALIYSIKIKYKENILVIITLILVFLSLVISIPMSIRSHTVARSSYSGVATNTGAMMMDGVIATESVASYSSSKTIGFSVGGAKDIDNFRENIKNNYLPLTTDLTYEGIFYDYYFDTGKTEPKDEMFYPSYSYAVSDDPISGEEEYYLSVGLNSNIKEEDFRRKKLNLVVMLDISGSMGSSFNNYYYDSAYTLGDILEGMSEEGIDNGKTKMQIANESVNLLIDKLNDDDRFGLVLFESGAEVAKPLNLVGETDMEAIKKHVLTITDQGGTNFKVGYRESTKLFNEYLNVDSNEYENRIIIVTDAMPNIGTTYSSGLYEYIKTNADNGINTTLIGVGVDFNTELVEAMSKVRGANYYSVHNSAEFKERMGEEFEFMVTPLVYDLKMTLESDSYEIKTVYGTNEADKATGEIMYVNTLFPSKSSDTGEVKGGIILLKLRKLNEDNSPLRLTVSYRDRSGQKFSTNEIFVIKASGETYQNTGIRKAILLTRYVNVLKSWIMYEKSQKPKYIIDDEVGIDDIILNEEQVRIELGQWERQSEALVVSDDFKETFKTFKEYLENEMQEIGDKTLKQEVEVLEKLIKY